MVFGGGKGQRMRHAMMVLAILLPVPAAAIPAGEFVDRWRTASKRPKSIAPEEAYAQLASDPEVKRLTALFSDALNKFRTEVLADRAAGRTPRSCPPKSIEFTVDGVIVDLERLPGDWRRRELDDAIADAIIQRYPCQPPVPASPAPGNDMTLNIRFADRSASAPVPIEYISNLVLFEAKLNGQPIRVLLDNASDKTILANDLVQRLGLRLGISGGALSTGRGSTLTRRIEHTTLEIPGAVTVTGPFVAHDLNPISKLAGRPVDAVLGGDILAHFPLVIVPEKKQMLMAKSFDITAASKITLPLIDGYIVDASINGHPVRLTVDLGYTGLVKINDPAWRRIFKDQSGVSGGAGISADGLSRAVRTIPATFAIGGISSDTLPVANGYDGKAADGLLGSALLRQFTLILDSPAKELGLIPTAAWKTPAK